jgi:hypothetical protein
LKIEIKIHKVSFGVMSQNASVFIRSTGDCADYFEIRDTKHGLKINFATGKIKVPVQTWYHLAAVFKKEFVSIYVDGKVSANTTGQNLFYTMNTVSDNNFIGMGTSLNGSQFISNIVLDEIKLFNKALTPEQVLLDVNASDGIASGICLI